MSHDDDPSHPHIVREFGHNRLHMENDPLTYLLYPNDFSPTLPTELDAGGNEQQHAEIWYDLSLFPSFLTLNIRAIQLRPQGAPQAQLYTTAAYRNPFAPFEFGLVTGVITAVLIGVYLSFETGREVVMGMLRFSHWHATRAHARIRSGASAAHAALVRTRRTN